MSNLKFTSAFIFFCTSNALEPPAQCKSLPVILEVILDWTNNMNSFDRNVAEQILLKTIPKLPDYSEVYINAIRDNLLTEIASFDTPHDNVSLSDSLRNFGVGRSGNSVNLHLVDEELGLRFSVNEYRQKAELVLVLVNAKTEATGTAHLLNKKKASLVVFGDHIPSSYIGIASNEKHVHLINKEGFHMTNVTDTILNQIFCDSEFLCDRDQYRTSRSNRCINCSNVCGDDENNESLACTDQCPFLYRPTPRVEILPGRNFLAAIIAPSIICILILLFSVVIFLLCRCKQQKQKNARTMEDILGDTFPVMEEGDLGVNDRQSDVHDPEAEGEQPDEDLSENSNTPLDEASSDAEDSSSDEEMPLCGRQTDLPHPNTTEIFEELRRKEEKEDILLRFSDVQATAHVFSGDPVKDLHEEKVTTWLRKHETVE